MGVALAPLDLVIIAGYLFFALGIGAYFARRAGKSIVQFFGSGKQLPWWVAGTSMVATTFASDTPLAVTGFVRTVGISGNWFWWNGVMPNMLATFLFAPLWRRSGVLTDLEFIAIRYSGAPATGLRIFRVLYSSLIANSIVMGWVIGAMVNIVRAILGWDEVPTLALLMGIAFAYAVVAGLWGVVLTDLLQFVVAMGGSILLAFFALSAVGGGATLVQKLTAQGKATNLHLIPLPSSKHAFNAFLVYMLVQWWSVGRPDSEGYLAQRLLATRDERNAMLSFLWFAFAHYALRPWFWIIVGLASLILIPQATVELGEEGAYPMMMVKLLPAGALGLLVAAMMGAFMSTIDTQLNWAASYLINDFYRPYIRPNAPEEHYVLASRIATTVVLALSVGAALVTEQVRTAWMLLAGLNTGIGLVSVLRWLWWRVNAWSEISAMGASLIVNAIIFMCGKLGIAPFKFLITNQGFPYRLLIILAITQPAWLLATFITPPEPKEKLLTFFQRIQPPPRWWRPIADDKVSGIAISGVELTVAWLSGVMFIYGSMFVLGGLLLAQLRWIIFGGIASLLGFIGTMRALSKLRSMDIHHEF